MGGESTYRKFRYTRCSGITLEHLAVVQQVHRFKYTICSSIMENEIY